MLTSTQGKRLFFEWFVWKRATFLKVRLYTFTFRNRKGNALKSVNKRFSPLKRRRESVASSPHIRISSVKLSRTSEILCLRSQMIRTARWGWYLIKCFGKHGSTFMPCHAAVCVNCALGSNVQFLRVITQSTGHTIAPSLPIGKKLGSNSTFMYRKTLCKVVEQCTEYIFVLSFIRLALFRQLNIKLTFSRSRLAQAN